jgi:formylglycine-generating enzyme required for sulfatase activity
MKTFKMFHWFLVVAILFAARPVLSQAPTLGVQLYAGINITGTAGRLFAVQATSNLADSNSWVCVDLVRLTTTNYLWTDTSKSAATGQRFYRTVSAATNLVYILPGTFTMGSPTNEALRGTDEVQHVVMITKGFYIGKNPVTQGDYVSVVGGNGGYFTPVNGYSQDLLRPVESVKWVDASNYCALRTANEQAAGLIPTNWVYRLPTESEWEYACRAGTTTAFYLSNGLASAQANFNGQYGYDAVIGSITNLSGVFLNRTAEVGSYAPPNGWGLNDMIGNVKEWCFDWYGPYPTSVPGANVIDPQGPATGPAHVLRSGSWLDRAEACRSACRFYTTDHLFRYYVAGFRVVLAPIQ